MTVPKGGARGVVKGISVKKLARDISEGYVTLTSASLKKYDPPELKILLVNMSIVQREIRAEAVDENDFDAVKKKNWRLQNLSRTILMVNGFIKHRRIKID